MHIHTLRQVKDLTRRPASTAVICVAAVRFIYGFAYRRINGPFVFSRVYLYANAAAPFICSSSSRCISYCNNESEHAALHRELLSLSSAAPATSISRGTYVGSRLISFLGQGLNLVDMPMCITCSNVSNFQSLEMSKAVLTYVYTI
jgi:hypothetical protein